MHKYIYIVIIPSQHQWIEFCSQEIKDKKHKGKGTIVITPKNWKTPIVQPMTNMFCKDSWDELNKSEQKTRPKKKAKTDDTVAFFDEPAEPVSYTLHDALQRLKDS